MFILGADVSTAEEVESLGGKFYVDGKEQDLFHILHDHGFNAVRLRLWNDPKDEQGNPYGAGNCDIDCVIRLARRAKKLNMKVLLDFHYSDFWVDPGKQYPPKAWRNFNKDQLVEAVYRYTSDTLKRMKDEGVFPEYVQVGNEITNGMLWDIAKLYHDGKDLENFDTLAEILRAGCNAVRDSGDSNIILHLERSGDNAMYRHWFDNVISRNVSFDTIGVSYYPFWHGDFDALQANLKDLATRYGKEIHVVETSYPFTSTPYAPNAPLALYESKPMWKGGAIPYPMTKQGQGDFLEHLINLLRDLPDGRGKAMWYWEPAWLAVEGSTWATESALEYMHEQGRQLGNEWANQALFDYNGEILPSLKRLKDIVNK